MSKLNLGCGYKHEEGWINVDSDETCNPDLCFDLTKPNWPVETSTITEVMAKHVLEHLEGTEGYLTFWKELYRVCADGAMVNIEVPHWEHETFYHDPTHVRAVTPIGIAMFDQDRNQQMLMNNDGETKLGFMCKVDFSMQASGYGHVGSTGQAMTCYYQTKAVKPARFKI
jgi:predicted SAM-dependent methyltransferase